MTGTDSRPVDPLLWTVWRVDMLRVAAQSVDGQRIRDHQELVWRIARLGWNECPFWTEYSTLAAPLVVASARQRYPGHADEAALQSLLQEMRAHPIEVITELRQLPQYAPLKHLVDTQISAWLDSEWNSASGDVPRAVASNPPEQIIPMALLAYRFHELATQITYLARSEPLDAAECNTATMDQSTRQALASCAGQLMQHAEYSRRCAAQIRDSAVQADLIASAHQVAPRNIHESDIQWWIDLTTRPITSQLRPTVQHAATAGERAELLINLADEADTLCCELGDAFEQAGWNRGIAGGAVAVGPHLRGVANRV